MKIYHYFNSRWFSSLDSAICVETYTNHSNDFTWTDALIRQLNQNKEKYKFGLAWSQINPIMPKWTGYNLSWIDRNYRLWCMLDQTYLSLSKKCRYLYVHLSVQSVLDDSWDWIAGLNFCHVTITDHTSDKLSDMTFPK